LPLERCNHKQSHRNGTTHHKLRLDCLCT
jgi:hypothetical protein